MRKKTAVFLLIFLLGITLFPLKVKADMGPKPKITIIVTNPPEEEYYLDILVNYDLPLYDNLKGKRDLFDQTKLSLLENYSENGWYPALAHGTRRKLWGNLKGHRKDQTMVHTFGYFGVPDRYKIIVVTPDNRCGIARDRTGILRFDHILRLQNRRGHRAKRLEPCLDLHEAVFDVSASDADYRRFCPRSFPLQKG